jgi:nucleotide-binding universal stress UspA family protein
MILLFRGVAMRMLQSVLFATDFHAASRAAEQAAARLGGAFGSRVHLLHVLEPLPGWQHALHDERERSRERLHEHAQRLTAAKVAVADRDVVVGPTANAIDRAAGDIDADLILIGAGERLAQEPFRAGPVAEAVVQHAAAPVLATRPGPPELCFRKILCPLDHSAVSRRGLENAVRLARAFGGQVVAVSVIPEVGWLTASASAGKLLGAREEYERTWRCDFQVLLECIDWGGVSWVEDLRRGEPHREIVAAAAEHGADLIVMGCTGRSGLARAVLGSVTRRVLRGLPCSLLAIKDEDAIEELFDEDLRHVEVLVAMGRALDEAGSLEQAAARFRQALARNPFHTEALEELAHTCARLGRESEAERCRSRLGRLRQQDRREPSRAHRE